MFSTGCSNYFFKRNPNKFGLHQKAYLEKVQEFVSEATRNIRQAVEEENDLEQVFHQLLDFFGTSRHKIAMEHRTEDAELYGVRRDGATFSGLTMFTSLIGSYGLYNKPLLSRIQTQLGTMKRSNKGFTQTTLQTHGGALGRETSLEFSILTPENKMEWAHDLTEDYYKKICDICEITLSNDSDLSQRFNQLVLNEEYMRRVKERSIGDYKKLKICSVINDIFTCFPGRKSDWVLTTVRCQMHGKMYALTQYLTWMYRTYNDDPVSYMITRKDPTIISLVHQDVFLIKETLRDIADLFKKAIEWMGESMQELVNLVGLINYLFAHAMPFKRGSAAIGEWLESTIYSFHGLELKYNEEVSINMEALTLPLEEFINKYPSYIQLQPIEQKSLTLK